MNATCRQYTFEDLNRFIDNDLPEEEINSIKMHMETCPACRAQVYNLQAISSAFKNRVSRDTARLNTILSIKMDRQKSNQTQKSFFNNVFGLFGQNIYLKLGFIAAILGISLFLFNTNNLLGPSGPSAIVNTVDTDMSSVMILETQKQKHTIIWITET